MRKSQSSNHNSNILQKNNNNKDHLSPTHLFLISYCFEMPKYILKLFIVKLITKLKQEED